RTDGRYGKRRVSVTRGSSWPDPSLLQRGSAVSRQHLPTSPAVARHLATSTDTPTDRLTYGSRRRTDGDRLRWVGQIWDEVRLTSTPAPDSGRGECSQVAVSFATASIHTCAIIRPCAQ